MGWLMAKFRCPWCKDKFGDGQENDWKHHITVHVVASIRETYPGLLEQIAKVEKEMPVKFQVKVDIDKAVADEGMVMGIADAATAALESSGEESGG